MGGFDRLLYAALFIGLVLLTLRGQDPAPPPLSEAIEGAPLPAPSLTDPRIMVTAPEGGGGPSSGSAFLIGPDAWLTAEHVVAGCGSVALAMDDGGFIMADRIAPSRIADAAVILTPTAGVNSPAPLPVVLRANDLRTGQGARHLGYPRGRAGEIDSQLMGRAILVTRGRVRRSEPVIAWAERRRVGALRGSLAGLSGGPALDREGEVVGVTVAENRRRGRIYTTAPQSIQALASGYTTGEAEPQLRDRRGSLTDRVAAGGRVAQVLCLPSGMGPGR